MTLHVRSGNDFLATTSKAPTTNKKIDKLDFIQIKTVYQKTESIH
jgi:hypothetical protein